MLLILAFVYFFQRFLNTDAAPLSVHIPNRTTINSPLLPQGCICSNSRTVWDVVWSCLATIFLCSWVSVHPNIPEKGEPWWQKALRRLELMLWSIISPELIIFWAMRQWLAARELKRIYKDYGWTKTHGYFIQMGGLMLYNGETAVEVIGPEKLESLVSSGKITPPSISEEDIQARSKGDGLAKALVIIQTTWFIAQCIARRIQGLVITEIELVTLAFATLNSVMYFLWWNKPLNVESTVPIYLKPAPVQGNEHIKNDEHRAQSTVADVTLSQRRVENVTNLDDNGNGNKFENDPRLINSPEVEVHPRRRIIPNHLGNLASGACRFLSGILFQWLVSGIMTIVKSIRYLGIKDVAAGAWWLLSGIVFHWPAAGIMVVFKRIGDIIYTSSIGEEYCALYAVLASVGAVFGAIHCAGWDFFFPSLIEADIWRVSSAIITGVPVLVFLAVMVIKPDDVLTEVLGYLVVGLVPFYILARLALLGEALILLRDLPPGTLEVVKWTLFLPHI